jgi:hypothetical protein
MEKSEHDPALSAERSETRASVQVNVAGYQQGAQVDQQARGGREGEKAEKRRRRTRLQKEELIRRWDDATPEESSALAEREKLSDYKVDSWRAALAPSGPGGAPNEHGSAPCSASTTCEQFPGLIRVLFITGMSTPPARGSAAGTAFDSPSPAMRPSTRIHLPFGNAVVEPGGRVIPSSAGCSRSSRWFPTGKPLIAMTILTFARRATPPPSKPARAAKRALRPAKSIAPPALTSLDREAAGDVPMKRVVDRAALHPDRGAGAGRGLRYYAADLNADGHAGGRGCGLTVG